MNDAMNRLQNIGYFLVEPIAKPACFDLPCTRLLSLSDCIVRIFPDPAERIHQDLPVWNLIKEGRFSPSDGRFSVLRDALKFYEQFKTEVNALRVIGQFAETDVVRRFVSGCESAVFLCKETVTPKKLLGGEILGEDGGLHSYLCNGLEKDLRKKFAVQWNDWGLIQNSYEEMRVFAEFLQGQGEPVEWLPYLLFDYTP